MRPETIDVRRLLDRARAVEQQMRDGQAALAKAVVTGRSSDGTVTVLAQGTGRIQAVQVDPSVFDRRDAAALQTAVVEAVRAAGENAGRLARQKLGPVEINLH